jgi:hypothetical protein
LQAMSVMLAAAPPDTLAADGATSAADRYP